MAVSFEIKLAEDRIIRADYFACQGESSLGLVILCHGYKGFKDWGMFPYVAERLSEACDVVTFNFSHNGVGADGEQFSELEKFARNTYSRELEDLETVIQYVRNSELIHSDPKNLPLYLLGHSRGAGVSTIYALDHPDQVAGVISWNGIVDVDVFSDEEKRMMRENGRAYVLNGRTKQHMPLDVEILEDMEQNRQRFDILGRISSLQVPMVVIQGTEDFVRLRKGNAELIQRQPNISYVPIEGGNHTFLAVHPFQGTTEPLEAAIAQTMEWIRSLHASRK